MGEGLFWVSPWVSGEGEEVFGMLLCDRLKAGEIV